MKEQLISFKTAKLAKEKGFDVSVDRYYDFIGDTCSNMGMINFNVSKSELYSAPTQSLLQKWLRENHTIHCVSIPTYQYENKPSWFYYVQNLESGCAIITQGSNPMDDYYNALELGLQKTLEYLNNHQ